MAPQASIASATPGRRGLSKATMVYDDLRSAIVTLALKPGIQIDKGEVCARLRVSRQPLADALSRLAEEQLVDVEPQKGTYVARIRLDDVIEAAFVRRALEVATVEAIAPSMDDATLADLERNLAYQATALRSKDTEGFHALDIRFHALITERIAMHRVVSVVERSRAQLERARRLCLPKPGRPQAALREHRAIFAALKARDAQAAAKAMSAHLDTVVNDVKELATEQPDLFES